MKTIIVKSKQHGLFKCSVIEIFNRSDRGFWLMIIFLMMGCSGTTRYDSEQSTREPAPVPEKQEPVSQPYAGQYFINDENSQTVGEIFLREPVAIRWNDINLYRVIKEEKFKYRDDNNTNIYEIKTSDDGFKLRDGKGNLLWKIKYKGGRVMVGNDEEMARVFEIRRSGNTAEILYGENKTGVLDMGSASIPMYIPSDGKKYYVTGPDKNIFFAVLGIKDIPADQRLVIICEILLKHPG